MPDPSRYRRKQNLAVQRIDAESLHLLAADHDPVAQRMASHRILMTTAGIRLVPVNIRDAWPAELNLMARLAGLRLEHRWASWRRQPFAAESATHVSDYRRPLPVG